MFVTNPTIIKNPDVVYYKYNFRFVYGGQWVLHEIVVGPNDLSTFW